MENPGIYILTNKINSKKYIGLDSNLPHRLKKHLRGKSPGCKRIHSAIQKYGAENFDVETIRYPEISRESLAEVEKWKIYQLNTLSPNGYNLTTGGEGNFRYSEETRDQISKSKKGQKYPPRSPEHRKNASRSRRLRDIRKQQEKESHYYSLPWGE